VRPVRVIATGPVASVVFQLDGKEVSRRPEVPWADDIDFGKEYAPHELVARAFDEKGTEIALARQWINLPRPAAEVEILLDRDASGKAVAARLVWASRMGPKPERLSLTLDGRDVAVDALHQAKLPSYDDSSTHMLTAQVDFAGDVRGRADVVLGGGSVDETGSELTAVPVRSADGKAPSADSLQGRFLRNGRPLRVTAVEHGPAEIILVRDTDAGVELTFRAKGVYGSPTASVGDEDRLRVQWPVARQVADLDAANVLFESSSVFSGSQASILSLLVSVAYPGESAQPRRFADSVAVAGLQAASSYSRRAVVLVLGRKSADVSHDTPVSVRRYLERLRVPLYVWSLIDLQKVLAAAWGSYEAITSLRELRQESQRIRKDVDSQSIVWLSGRYLPQDIVFVEKGDGLSLVR
jgi:hypothetical protein